MKITLLIFVLSIFNAHANQCGVDTQQVTGTSKCNGKKIHLTFDDGPHIVFTKKILDSLKAQGVPATFFVSTYNFDKAFLEELERKANKNSGRTESNASISKRVLRNISTRKDLVRRIAADNNLTLASHAHLHEAHDARIKYGKKVKSFDEDESYIELEKSLKILNRMTNDAMAKQGEDQLVRFPFARGISPGDDEFELIRKREKMHSHETKDDYIKKHSHAMRNASRLNLSHFGWNHDSGDSNEFTNSTKSLNPSAYVDQFIQKACNEGGRNLISLLHDIQKVNALESKRYPGKIVMDEIIEKLECLGAKFVSAKEIKKEKLDLKVYTPATMIANNTLKNSLDLFIENKILPDADVKNCSSEENSHDHSIGGCTHSVSSAHYDNCKGTEKWICYEGKWFEKKGLENPSAKELEASMACTGNPGCYSKFFKRTIEHCDPNTEQLCFAGKWRKRDGLEQFCD